MPFGIPLEAWTIADGPLWLELRGAYTAWCDENKKGQPVDLMQLLGEVIQGVQNKTFWVVNQTSGRTDEMVVSLLSTYPRTGAG